MADNFLRDFSRGFQGVSQVTIPIVEMFMESNDRRRKLLQDEELITLKREAMRQDRTKLFLDQLNKVKDPLRRAELGKAFAENEEDEMIRNSILTFSKIDPKVGKVISDSKKRFSELLQVDDVFNPENIKEIQNTMAVLRTHLGEESSEVTGMEQMFENSVDQMIGSTLQAASDAQIELKQRLSELEELKKRSPEDFGKAVEIAQIAIQEHERALEEADIRLQRLAPFASENMQDQLESSIEDIGEFQEGITPEIGTGGVFERLAQRIMADNPGMSFTEAFKIAKRQTAGEAEDIAQAKAGVEIETAADIEQRKQTGEDIGKLNTEQYQSTIKAVDNLNKSNNLISHLKTSKAITGIGAEFFKDVERIKVLLGGTLSEDVVSATELLDVMMGSEVFPLIKSLGIGARGLDTPAEREFLRQVMTGTITLNKKTLLRMAEMRRDEQKEIIKKWDDRVDRGELDTFFESSGITKQKFGSAKTTETPRASGVQEGQTATNPQTGEKIIFRGGQWQPL
jgi:hypothetical protein